MVSVVFVRGRRRRGDGCVADEESCALATWARRLSGVGCTIEGEGCAFEETVGCVAGGVCVCIVCVVLLVPLLAGADGVREDEVIVCGVGEVVKGGYVVSVVLLVLVLLLIVGADGVRADGMREETVDESVE